MNIAGYRLHALEIHYWLTEWLLSVCPWLAGRNARSVVCVWPIVFLVLYMLSYRSPECDCCYLCAVAVRHMKTKAELSLVAKICFKLNLRFF